MKKGGNNKKKKTKKAPARSFLQKSEGEKFVFFTWPK